MTPMFSMPVNFSLDGRLFDKLRADRRVFRHAICFSFMRVLPLRENSSV